MNLNNKNNNNHIHHPPSGSSSSSAIFHLLLNQFQILLRRSATLLHPNSDVVLRDHDDDDGDDDFIFATTTNTTTNNNNYYDNGMEKQKSKKNGRENQDNNNTNNNTSDSESDDDDDDGDHLMRMMMGGDESSDGGGLYDSDNECNMKADNKHADCEDSSIDYDANEEKEEGEEVEDVPTLLKRASSVHAALLLTLPSILSTLFMAENNNMIHSHGSNDNDDDILIDGRELAETLVAAILCETNLDGNADQEGEEDDDDDDRKKNWVVDKTGKKDLVNILSFFCINNNSTSSSSLLSSSNNNNDGYDNNSSKLFSQSQSKQQQQQQQQQISSSSSRYSYWNREKVHLTSSLLAVQFLFCVHDIIIILRKQEKDSTTSVLTSTKQSSDLGKWEGAMTKVILPLFFGMTSTTGKTTKNNRTTLFLTNDILRNAVLDLIPFSLDNDHDVCQGQAGSTSNTAPATCTITTGTATDIIAPPSVTMNLCLDILEYAMISSTSKSDTTSSLCLPLLLRQKIIVVICQIFIRMHDDGRNKKNRNKSSSSAAVIVIQDAMHRSVVMMLRQMRHDCHRCTTNSDDGRLSPESLLRPITGLLLPTLYGCQHQRQQNLQDHHPYTKNPQSMQAIAIDDEVNDAKEKCKAGAKLLWNEILLLLDEEYNAHDDERHHRPDNWAPMTITALLCLLLPTFRGMELPSSVVAASSSSDIKYCRPIFQPYIWKLIRSCLGRCGGEVCSAEANTVDGCGVGGGRGTSLLSRASNNNDSCDRVVMDQLLRRRSAHALRLMLEHERERLIRCNSGSRTKDKKDTGGKRLLNQKKGRHVAGNDESLLRAVDMWTKYVLCFEMLEMEIELHLVEQVWSTVKEITSEVAADSSREVIYNSSDGSILHIPRLTWDDIGSLLSRVLLSDAPTMRKLGLYRFLSGHTGVNVTAVSTMPDANNSIVANSTITSGENVCQGTTYMEPPKSKGKVKRKSGAQLDESAPLSIVSVDFVLDVVMRAYDSIVGTKVGSNMNIDDEGQQKSVSIADLLSHFLSNYTVILAEESTRLSEFVNRVFGPDLIQSHKSRSLVLYYRSVSGALDTIASSGIKMLTIDPENMHANIRSMRTIFSSGGAPKSMQQGLKLDLALMIRSSTPWKTVDPSIVLKVLALYPPSEELNEVSTDCPSVKSRDALGAWLRGLGDGKWAQNAPPACASAFVSGQLLPFVDAGTVPGVSSAERETGMSICILCSLAGSGSEFLWPAVFKGLQIIPTNDSTSPGFYMASRSMILLEYGCKEGVLSGMGNGDLLVDESKEYMMPPPPQIEAVLSNAVQFIMSQLISMSTNLFKIDSSEKSGGSTRSSSSNSASSYIAILIGQLRVLRRSFPSSVSLSQAVNIMFEDCIHQLTDIENADTSISTSKRSVNVVKFLTLSYAVLSCGATFSGENKLRRLISTCKIILNIELYIPPGIKNDAKQTMRSIHQYSKWGALSLILSNMMSEVESHVSVDVDDVYQSILESARNSVDSTPVIALPPLFECAISAGKHIASFDGQKNSFLTSLQSIIETLFAVLEEDSASSNWTYMLNEMCKLLFRGRLLLEEYNFSYSKDSCGPMPIMQAFVKLLRMGGSSKPYIYKTVVSRISVAWLGPDGESESAMGLCAIPYRDHVVDLLVYKECKTDESSAHMSEGVKWDILPETTDASSITRAFVLSFLSNLPPVQQMSDVVLKEFIHVVIMKLIAISCTAPDRGKAFISGSEVYARMIRSWQALCILSGYVTEDIASDVAIRVYHAMSFTIHGQIRYFMEVFTIQCTRLHPMVFGQKYIQEIRRNDLSLQHISSLMIIGGNLTAGQCGSSFFRSSVDATSRMKEVLCGVLPWLSSTQSFSRAIAQLLCHKLIPLVVNVNVDASVHTHTNDSVKDSSVLRSIYFFLENNTEMTRLRKKQQLFFDAYDVDRVCSFEGILSIPVDEGEEANPTYMVDVIKDCLSDIYQEAHEEDAPVWKQMEDLLIEADDVANRRQRSLLDFQNNDDDDDDDDDNDNQNNETEEELVNFQRKILPIDALDLGIRSHHEQKLFNAAGKKKQCLIVCASLIDKVPNLAGLARTCEIFSAQTLVLPNLLVKKQDDFKSISASANDWIEMEECKEDHLLNWLYKKKHEGYEIVGVEQTSSSKCLTKMEFHEKTVLLLGKEKEGIPMEFLSAVDQCIEIPQLGIIRSLNVHVSGAISIWEYTKQRMAMTEKKGMTTRVM